MLFYSTEDFFEKCGHFHILRREEECQQAQKMKCGDSVGRQCLIGSYLPMVASYIRRMPLQQQTLGMILYCCQALEKAVDTYNFLQENETFAHRLSWYLRNASARYIAERYSTDE